MGPQQGRARQGVHHPRPTAAGLQHPCLCPGGRDSEQQEQRVHPRLLRVPDRERGEDTEGRRGQPGAPVVEITAGQVKHRDQQAPGHDRGQPDSELARPEQVDL